MHPTGQGLLACASLPLARHSICTQIVTVTKRILGHQRQFQRGRQKGWLPELAPLPGGPPPPGLGGEVSS